MLKYALIPVLVVALGCSDGNESKDSDNNGNTSGSADTDDAGFVIPKPANPISCENACKRPPGCEEELGTEVDCLANCNGNDNPETYACCIQYADGCAAVEQCITSVQVTCTEEGDPWVPLAIFDKCDCGDPEDPPPNYNECANEGGDTPCETGLCLKPVNYSEPAFCATECDPASKPCPDPYVCQETPKKNYCKRPFG